MFLLWYFLFVSLDRFEHNRVNFLHDEQRDEVEMSFLGQLSL